jgi:hypothetical protein
LESALEFANAIWPFRGGQGRVAVGNEGITYGGPSLSAKMAGRPQIMPKWQTS